MSSTNSSISDEKKKRLEEIKREWGQEMEKIEREMPNPNPPTLDGPKTWAYAKLAHKYQKLIREVLRDNVD